MISRYHCIGYGFKMGWDQGGRSLRAWRYTVLLYYGGWGQPGTICVILVENPRRGLKRLISSKIPALMLE